ncbi:MAG: pyruvate kinase [Bryobacteraceae bacterium]
MPNTKIVATLGPSSDSPEVLRLMLEAGLDVVRLNASHGTQEEHTRRVQMVRQVSAQCGRHVGILLDLQGPKIRLGRFEAGRAELADGAEFTITTEPVVGNAAVASTGYAGFARDVRAGDRVLLADGAVQLRAIHSDGVRVRFEVVSGGPVGDNKGINLPGVAVSAESLTDKDIRDLHFGVDQGVDIVALSFVRKPEDVRRLRAHLEGPRIPVVAKIEKPEAWDNLDAILEEADGVMVARGDLGVEMALEKVPHIQKTVIRQARQRSCFVITATQMLESMIDNPSPTRAEVSDVANAIYDGTDAVMLSAETSIGKHPVEAVRMMAKIAAEAERSCPAGNSATLHLVNPSHAEIIAQAAHDAAADPNMCAVVVFTSGGSSARQISRFHPADRIYAITPRESVARQLSVHYGVTPILAEAVFSTDEMVALADRILLDRGLLRPGDSVVFVAGQPIGRPGTTNFLKLHRIGESVALG